MKQLALPCLELEAPVLRQLDRLGLGARLKAFQHNGRPYRLPPPGSVPLDVEDDVGAVASVA